MHTRNGVAGSQDETCGEGCKQGNGARDGVRKGEAGCSNLGEGLWWERD